MLTISWSRCAAIICLLRHHGIIDKRPRVKTVTRSLILPYSAAEMYDLVADVEHYEDFLPWCAGSEVLSSDDERVTARLSVRYSQVRSSFTTCNHLSPKQTIRMELVDGPFSELMGEWQFVSLGESACRVELEISFSFAGGLKERLMASVFDRVCNELADAFAARAVEIHGERAFA